MGTQGAGNIMDTRARVMKVIYGRIGFEEQI